jgi:hypothetical protein
MVNIRLSPSKINAFASYLAEHPWATKENLISSIKGESQYSPAMDFGTAFHYLIEHGINDLDPNIEYLVNDDNPEDEPMIGVKVGTELIGLTVKYVEMALDFRRKHPLMAYEVPYNSILKVGGYRVHSFMFIDGMEGNLLHEQKTTKNFKQQSYIDSYQWRMYLYATGLDRIDYNVFEIRDNKKGKSIKYHNIPMARYEGMEADIFGILDDLIYFCESNNLIEFITVNEKGKRINTVQ